ncbi:G-type lectin S-receptor-like serine/threonine-protein kinase B120 [Humulus lupulus]|uniref:G-type lectin S-receptor-like serine/threonine-protein kinase B120 n=1 Tax=Humulus lupulus TaxID=3486 RepID=UPI002B4053AD|nr:G-type lectin S-receptor-like serine/threonine-protein kinase B120 [Humulus lupulus]
MTTLSQTPCRVLRIWLVVFVVSSFALLCSAIDTISQGQSIRDGESSSGNLVSAGDIFELGFFSPVNSTSRFVGIWYWNDPEITVVWVANREKAIPDRKGILTLESDGSLVIYDGSNNSIWTSNSNVSSVVSKNITAKLSDDGNLALSNGESSSYWESFNDPTDTNLPGMKVEVSAAKGVNRVFTSWKSINDPSPGNFTMGVDPRGSPQIVIWEGPNRRWRSGHWNWQIFLGVPNMTANLLYGFRLGNENGTQFFTYVTSEKNNKLRFRVEWNGFEKQYMWRQADNKWDLLQSQPAETNDCEHYNKCGEFGVCSSWESVKCRCMEGYQPTSREEWNKGNWSSGCTRKTPLRCQKSINGTEGDGEEDEFTAQRWVKLPDFADLVRLLPPSAAGCKDECLTNCSCIAYAFVDGIGCLVWTETLLDVQHFQRGGATLNIRLAHSDLGERSKKSTTLIIVLTVLGAALLGFIWLVWRFRYKLKVLPTSSTMPWSRSSEIPPSSDVLKSKEYSTELSGSIDVLTDCPQGSGPELPLFSFNFVAISTNNFSEENKLGQGGFGHVYKGKLPGGHEIAVKRLSRKSGQGVEEFKNEIILIAKLQHRNLVRLLGCCIQGEEKMLLYEYMPNKSLDFFLFNPEKQALLNWNTRFNIIEGIARGLLYLHRDSRLRIIHRDLKASNILLDEEMIPKISDFGMARIFGGNQNEANTNRVVGTYGYMSPEYAMEGLFSVKSDVYSFGVLLLEIVSGRRNVSFRNTDYLSLIGYAWHLWNERRPMELLDPSIADTCSRNNEVLRCIQVGVLCVQDSPLHRPTMSSVVLMLESENANLPLPREPTYTSLRGSNDTDFCSDGPEYASLNELTVTMVDGR